jgi:hypothetical protein
MDFATRYDFLKSAIARYDGYYNLAAVKASLLLTSNAIFLAPSLGERGQLLGLAGAHGAGRVLIGVSAAASLLSIALSAWVIAAVLGRRRHAPARPSLAFSESVAAMPLDDYTRGIAALDEATVLDDLSRLSHLLATGLAGKFRLINASLAALVLAIAAACAALVA